MFLIEEHIASDAVPSAGLEVAGYDEKIVHAAVVEAQPPAVVLVYLQQGQAARMSLADLVLIRLAQQDVTAAGRNTLSSVPSQHSS